MKKEDVLVIVRTTEERTAQECKIRLIDKFGSDNVIEIANVTPFSEAIKEAYKTALIYNRKWTLIVDGDVFFFDNIDRFIEACDEHSSNTGKGFVYNALVYDKFMMQYRIGGGHLYRTIHLRKAMKFVDKSKIQLRPETFVKREMAKRGYPCYYTEYKIGIHDFCQYPHDIFRKGILHAKKHGGIDDLIKEWEKLKEMDEDFAWICKGVEVSHTIDEVIVDKKFFEKYYGDIECKDINTDTVSEIIQEMLKKYYVFESDIVFKPVWKRQDLYILDIEDRLKKVFHKA